MLVRAGVVAGVLMCGGGVTVAAPCGDPPASPQPADADALKGPTVREHTAGARPSIVERDFNGRVKKLDDHPVLVALGRLDLTPEERKAADTVIGDRAAALDAIVRDHIKEIVELAGAKAAKDGSGAARLQAELLQAAQPFFRRGPLLGEMRPALPEAKYAELKRMVEEYQAATRQDRMEDPMAGGAEKKQNALGLALAQGFEGFAQEARASYQRVVEAGGKEFEQLLKMLQLTPEQEGKIRQQAIDLYLKTYGKPTRRQQFALFMSIYGTLDTEQRHRLAEYVGEQRRARSGAAKASS